MVNKPLAAIAIGFLRYSKALSRKAWMKLMNINEKKMKEAQNKIFKVLKLYEAISEAENLGKGEEIVLHTGLVGRGTSERRTLSNIELFYRSKEVLSYYIKSRIKRLKTVVHYEGSELVELLDAKELIT